MKLDADSRDGGGDEQARVEMRKVMATNEHECTRIELNLICVHSCAFVAKRDFVV